MQQAECHGHQQPLERAADVKRQRSGPPPRPARQGDALADRQNPWVLALQQRARIGPRLANQLPACANRGARIRRGNDQHAMSPVRKLLRGPPDELVDPIPAPPGMRADLSYGERVAAAHRRSIDTRNGARGPRFSSDYQDVRTTWLSPSPSSPSCPSWAYWPGARADARTCR